MGVKKVKLDVGSNLRMIQWADIVHPSEDGYVTIATRSDKGWHEQSYPVDIWYNYIVQDDEVDCYYTPNTIYKPHRLAENARQINAFYVDLDFYKYGLSFDEVMTSIEFLIQTERLLEPTFIVYSGQGLYLFWQIESVPAKYKQVLKLFSHIQEFLIDTLKDLGADRQAKDVVRVLRVPTSINTKTGETVRILNYSKKFYTMRCLQQFMNETLMIDISMFKQPSRKLKRTKKSKVKYLYNYYTLAVARANDIRTICKLRNYDIKGYRNAFVHVYAYQMFLIHNNYHVARSFVLEFNDDLLEPLHKLEVESIVKSTFRAYENHRNDISKGYNYKNETLIQLFGITDAEQRHLKTLITKGEKLNRKNVARRESRRAEDGLTVRERTKQEKIKQVIALKEQGLKQVEIAAELGISTRYVKKILNGK